MTILVTGIDGYIGWPLSLKLSKEFKEERIVGIDNLSRRRWVEEIGSVSAIPTPSMDKRIQKAHEKGFENISFVYGDLTDRHFVDKIIRVYKPHTIIHLAAQPSAPYSQINWEGAYFTQFNNNLSTLNLLWALKENNLSSTHFIVTTTTGVYGAPEFEIPEGFIEVERKNKKDTIPFGGMAGSWYHMSKCNDVNNLYLANRQFKIPITDLRTSIVYGTQTKETLLDSDLATRFDFDFYFGVVVNRFCSMAIAGYPITIYGKGEQKKPMISLEDCCRSIVNAVKAKNEGKFLVYNQVEKPVSINELANAVKASAAKLGINVEVVHITNPRIEKEEHEMEVDTTNFRRLLGGYEVNIEKGVLQTLQSLLPYKNVLLRYKDRFLEAK